MSYEKLDENNIRRCETCGVPTGHKAEGACNHREVLELKEPVRLESLYVPCLKCNTVPDMYTEREVDETLYRLMCPICKEQTPSLPRLEETVDYWNGSNWR